MRPVYFTVKSGARESKGHLEEVTEPRLAVGPAGLTKLVAPSVLTVKTESSPWSNDGPLVYKLGLIIVKSSQNKRRVYEATVLIIAAQVRIAVAMTNYSQNA